MGVGTHPEERFSVVSETIIDNMDPAVERGSSICSCAGCRIDTTFGSSFANETVAMIECSCVLRRLTTDASSLPAHAECSTTRQRSGLCLDRHSGDQLRI